MPLRTPLLLLRTAYTTLDARGAYYHGGLLPNPVSTLTGLRHVDVKADDAIKLFLCDTGDNTADLKTKALMGAAFVKHRASILGLLESP